MRTDVFEIHRYTIAILLVVLVPVMGWGPKPWNFIASGVWFGFVIGSSTQRHLDMRALARRFQQLVDESHRAAANVDDAPDHKESDPTRPTQRKTSQ